MSRNLHNQPPHVLTKQCQSRSLSTVVWRQQKNILSKGPENVGSVRRHASRLARWHIPYVHGIEVVRCHTEAMCCHDSADGIRACATAVQDAALYLHVLHKSSYLQQQAPGEPQPGKATMAPKRESRSKTLKKNTCKRCNVTRECCMGRSSSRLLPKRRSSCGVTYSPKPQAAGVLNCTPQNAITGFASSTCHGQSSRLGSARGMYMTSVPAAHKLVSPEAPSRGIDPSVKSARSPWRSHRAFLFS